MARRIRLFKQEQRRKNKLRQNISLPSRYQRWSFSKTTGRWERTPTFGRVSNRPVQHQMRYEKEQLEPLVLQHGMCETDSNDTAITNDPTINLIAPSHNIDMKHILMAVREDMLINKRLIFSRNIVYKHTDVVVPSLRSRLTLEWKDPYIILTKGVERPMKIPMELEDGMVPESVIDVICAIIEMKRING